MSWFLSLLITVIAGVGVLVSGVFTIVKLTGKEKQSAVVPGSILIFCILLGALSGMIFFKKTSEKIRKTSANIHDFMTPDTTLSEDKRAFMIRIRQMAPEALRDSIPPGFYSGEKEGMARIPMRYPWSIEINGRYGESTGGLVQDGEGVVLGNVDRIAFDANFILLRTNNYPEGMDDMDRYELPPYTFYIYDLSTGKQFAFTSGDEMFDVAFSKGYTGDSTLVSLMDIWYRLFNG